MPLRPVMASTTQKAESRQRWLFTNVCFSLFLAVVLVSVTPLQDTVQLEAAAQGALLNELAYIGLFLALFFGGAAFRSRGRMIPFPPAILVMLGYCLLTVTWAIMPSISFRRFVLMAVTFWIVFRCVRDLGYRQTLLIVHYALAGLLILNYLTVWLSDAGIHAAVPGEEASVIGDWRGIMPHKNIAGAVCALTVILGVFDLGRISKFITFPTIIGSLVFLYFTHAKTSEVMLGLALLSGWLIRPYSSKYRTLVGGGIVVGAIVALQIAMLYSDGLVSLLDDPRLLTGRGSIWPLLLDYASTHLWFGAGFACFWQIGDASPIWSLTSGWVARLASHGHNGYLDLLVTIGLPGLLLALVVTLILPFARLLFSQAVSKPERSLLVTMLVFCAGYNLSESTLLNGAAVVEVFLVMTLALIAILTEPAAFQPVRPRSLELGA